MKPRHLGTVAAFAVVSCAVALSMVLVAHAQQAPQQPPAQQDPAAQQPPQQVQQQQPQPQPQQQFQGQQQQPQQQPQQQFQGQQQRPQQQPQVQQQQPGQGLSVQGQQAARTDQPGQQRPMSEAQAQQLLARPVSDNAVDAQLAHPTGDPGTSSVIVSRRGSPEIRVGEPYRYTIRVQNVTDQPLAAVTITEALGEGIDVVAAEPWGDTGANGQFRWNLGTLAPNETKAIEVAAIPTRQGSFASCLAVEYQPALCATFEVVNPQIRLSKQGPREAYVCDEIVYRYAVSNTGTGDADNVVIREILPDGLTSFDGAGEITHEFDTIGPGETRVFQARLQPSRPGEYTTRAMAAMGEQQVYSDPVSTVIYQPELAVQVNAPEWQFAGQPVNFLVQVTNTSDVPARDATLVLDTPDVPAGERERDLGDLRPGETKAVNVTIRGAANADALRLVAVAESWCARSEQAMAATEVRRIPALLVETVDNRDPVPIGETTTYTVVVKNQGTGPAENVVLRAQVPEELEILGSRGESQIQQQGNELVFSPVGSLAPGEVASWYIEARALQPGDVQFRVELMSDFLDQPTPSAEPTRLVAVDTPSDSEPGGALGPERGRSASAQEVEQIDRPRVRIGGGGSRQANPPAQGQQPQ